ncbi:sodium/glutamate symporter [Rhizobium sp. ACO-34A]|nr:sodium/glutamate symporter [Rhizobium sp. ACO-34A]ATN34404.1 sodium/glutamate symporter [Rhizobium sp. ACO-34A]
MEVGAFLSFNLAIVLLIGGKLLTMKIAVLRKYSIPDPVAGGFVCAAVVGAIFLSTGQKVEFALGVRDFLLLIFFGGIGLNADVRTLLRGGRPLAVLLILAAVFIVLQNVAGTSIAALFGHDSKVGLMAGSISLVGGVGTTLAWAPIFVAEHGITNALEIGIAANTLGLIAACVIGGPIATYLISSRQITVSGDANLNIGASYQQFTERLDYFCVLWAILAVNLTVMLGTGIDRLIALTGLTLPTFVSCLFAGILIRNLMPMTIGTAINRLWPRIDEGLTLISDLSLGLFLTMALMGLKIWELQGSLVFLATVLSAQVVLTVLYVIFVVFPAMGGDYEAVVVSAGFSGISLGSTATAVANMTAVTQQHGAAHRAFIIVPLVCGFFIDLVNAFAISAFLR